MFLPFLSLSPACKYFKSLTLIKIVHLDELYWCAGTWGGGGAEGDFRHGYQYSRPCKGVNLCKLHCRCREGGCKHTASSPHPSLHHCWGAPVSSSSPVRNERDRRRIVIVVPCKWPYGQRERWLCPRGPQRRVVLFVLFYWHFCIEKLGDVWGNFQELKCTSWGISCLNCQDVSGD